MPDEKKKTSGEHPAVQQFRAKMESISDEEGMTAGALLNLDSKLEAFLEESRSMRPGPVMDEPEPVPDTIPEEPRCAPHGIVLVLCVLCAPPPAKD